MPNIKSQEKRDRQNKVRNLKNKALKARIKHFHKKFLEAVDAKDTESAKENLDLLYKALDKAAKNNAVHSNFVANRKSGAAKKLTSIKA